MSDSLVAQASEELEITALLHISAWDFGIMHGLLTYLQTRDIISTTSPKWCGFTKRWCWVMWVRIVSACIIGSMMNRR
jgi:hypothetical protein